jgi:uncharacterized membrane protein
MRIASGGHAAFAAVMIALGIQGLITGQLTAVWQPIPETIPAQKALAYLCAFVSLACGAGLLWKRRAAPAARVLLAFFVLWTLVFRVPVIVHAPLSLLPWYSGAETTVMVAGAGVLYAWFATDADRHHVGWATGDRGVRIARLLYGPCMIPFGLGHIVYIQRTASMVPSWLPAHVAWGYATGVCFLMAAAGILLGVFARLAAALSALMIGLFTVLVWIPILAPGSKNPYDWVEFATSVAITAAGWVVADSYRDVPWVPHRSHAVVTTPRPDTA